MLRKSLLMTLALVFVLSLALIGCAPERDEAPVDPGEAADPADLPEKPDELVVWANDNEAQLDAIEEIAARYEAETGISVTIEAIDMFEQTDLITLDGPAGRGPDLFFQPHDRTGDIAIQGLALPLNVSDDILAEYTEESLLAVTYEGEMYGMPLVVETYALMYNTDLVPEAPQTLDELLEIAADLTNVDADEYGFLAEANNFYFAYPYFAGYGGYVFGLTEDGFDPTDIGLANEGAVQGGELIQQLFAERYIPRTINAEILNGLFEAGNVGVVISGPWNIPSYSAALGDSLATAPLPTFDGEQPATFSGVKAWMVSGWTEHEYWATDLAIFMTNYESSLHYYEVAGEMPPRAEILEDPIVTENPLIEGFAAQAQVAQPMPNIPEMSDVWEPMGDALQFLAQGDDVREVLEEAVETIREKIELRQAE